MGSISPEQQLHKFHHSYLTKKSLRDIDIPPRKLLNRRSSSAADMFADSPKADHLHSSFSKFLPYNNLDDDDDSDPYSSDHFRIYEFKVRKCTRSRSHDWTDCPFAHPGEKARRRDPRRFHYSGTVCSDFRKGICAKGDNCEFSHGVFECWLHPTRYRTEACKDGKNCKRKVCFFAHSSRQLRILPEPSSPPSVNPTAEKYHHHCCMLCHGAVAASPTSTLMGVSHLSPPVSPPISPVDCSSPEFSRYGRGDRFSGVDCLSPAAGGGGGSGMTYKDALTELMGSLEGMGMNESGHHQISHGVGRNRNLPWLDVNFGASEEQPQFVLSPAAPSPSSGTSKFYSGESKFYGGEFSGGGSRNMMMDEGRTYSSNINEGNLNLGGPDLGWVNDLLT